MIMWEFTRNRVQKDTKWPWVNTFEKANIVMFI